MKCKKIPGFHYVVSQDGKIFRKASGKKKSKKSKKEALIRVDQISEVSETPKYHKIKPATNDDGYKTVVLYKDGNPHFKYVHNLVANAWNGDSKGKPIVNHKDGDKTNDSADNLEYATGAQNTQHAYDRGLAKPPKGEINGKSVLTKKQVAKIKKSKETGVKLADMYDTTPENISMIRNNKRW